MSNEASAMLLQTWPMVTCRPTLANAAKRFRLQRRKRMLAALCIPLNFMRAKIDISGAAQNLIAQKRNIPPPGLTSCRRQARIKPYTTRCECPALKRAYHGPRAGIWTDTSRNMDAQARAYGRLPAAIRNENDRPVRPAGKRRRAPRPDLLLSDPDARFRLI